MKVELNKVYVRRQEGDYVIMKEDNRGVVMNPIMDQNHCYVLIAAFTQDDIDQLHNLEECDIECLEFFIKLGINSKECTRALEKIPTLATVLAHSFGVSVETAKHQINSSKYLSQLVVE